MRFQWRLATLAVAFVALTAIANAEVKFQQTYAVKACGTRAELVELSQERLGELRYVGAGVSKAGKMWEVWQGERGFTIIENHDAKKSCVVAGNDTPGSWQKMTKLVTLPPNV